MKIIALDIGDRWTGIALSDPLHIIATPYETVETKDLVAALKNIIAQESVDTVVWGHPKTLRGTESAQTRKVEAQAEALEKELPHLHWKRWDERLTSKQAHQIQQPKDKASKLASHAIAAALILRSYLDHLNFQKSLQITDDEYDN